MPKFLKRLLFFTLILGALPVISVGLISYSISTQDIEQKVRESNMQILLQTQMRVEQVLRTLESSAIQFANSPSVSNLADFPLTAEDFDQVKELTKGLYHLQTLSGINEATLINFGKAWTINFRMFRPLADNPLKEQFAAFAKQSSSLFWISRSDAPETGTAEAEGSTVETSAKRTVSMVLKIPAIPMTTTPKQMLVIDIVAPEIQNLLAVTGSHQTYVLDKQGSDLLGGASGGGEHAQLNGKIMQYIQQDSLYEGFFTFREEHAEYGVTYRNSDYNGWTYVSVVSMKELTKQSRKIATITWIVCLLVVAIVAAIAFYGSRRMYSPIRRLFEATREMDENEGQERSKDEFTFIEDRLRKLSTTGKELQHQLRGQYGQLKEYFVVKLINGQIHDKEYADRAYLYGLPAGWSKLAVLALQIDTIQDTRYREHDKELLLFAINNMVGELLPESRRLTPILIEQTQVTVVTSDCEDPAELKRELYGMAEKMKAVVDEYLQLKVSVGISKPYEPVSGTMAAFSEAQQALKSRINLGYDIIVHYEDVEVREQSGSSNHYHRKLLEEQIVGALKIGDLPKAEQSFDQYAASIVQHEVGYSDYSSVMMQLISKVYQLVQERGKSIKTVLGEGADIEHFMKLGTVEEIAHWFKNELFAPFVRFLNDQEDTQYLDIANQMVKLIHDKYDEDLSLELCAATLNFHPVYLSRVFKKEIGINFSEYLVEYRMNIAKTMLENSTTKIADIAEKLKYTNTSAFIRTFRKIVGMTPGQYRDQFGKK